MQEAWISSASIAGFTVTSVSKLARNQFAPGSVHTPQLRRIEARNKPP